MLYVQARQIRHVSVVLYIKIDNHRFIFNIKFFVPVIPLSRLKPEPAGLQNEKKSISA